MYCSIIEYVSMMSDAVHLVGAEPNLLYKAWCRWKGSFVYYLSYLYRLTVDKTIKQWSLHL